MQYYLADNSFAFGYDEGVYLQTAFQHAKGQALYKDLFLSQPPLLIEALSLLIKLFGNNVTIARSFIIITGFFTLVCTYLIAKELFNYRTAIFAFIIAGINFFLFQESKLVHSNMPSLAFALFTIYGAIKYNKTKKIPWIILSSLLFALSNTFKLLELFFIFPILFLLTVNPLGDKSDSLTVNRFKQVIINYLLYAIVFAAALAIILSNYHIKSLIPQVIGMGTKDVLHVSKNIWKIGSAYVGYQPGLFIFSIAGLVMIYRYSKNTFYFFVIWILAQLLFHTLMAKRLLAHHLIVLYPVLSIVTSAAIDTISRNYKSGDGIIFKRVKRKKALFFTILLLFVVLIFTTNIYMIVDLSNRAIKENRSPEIETLLNIIRTQTSSTDLVVSDVQMATFITERFTYPHLVDTSKGRISMESLNEEDLLKLKTSPRMIIFWSNRLNRFVNYHKYVQDNYQLIYSNKNREIFLKSH